MIILTIYIYYRWLDLTCELSENCPTANACIIKLFANRTAWPCPEAHSIKDDRQQLPQKWKPKPNALLATPNTSPSKKTKIGSIFITANWSLQRSILTSD